MLFRRKRIFGNTWMDHNIGAFFACNLNSKVFAIMRVKSNFEQIHRTTTEVMFESVTEEISQF